MIYSVGVFNGGLITLIYLIFKNPEVFPDMVNLKKMILPVLGIVFLIAMTKLRESLKEKEEEEDRRDFINKMIKFDKRENEK